MSRLLGCAVIGAGQIGTLHAQTLLSLPLVRLVAVVDPDRDAALRAAEDRLTSTHLDGALKNPGVDAVVIASPTRLHAEHIVACARAGKAIFCEQPIGHDLAAARAALAVVAETQVPFQIGFQRRYDPGFAAAREHLGDLGRLVMLRVQSCDGGLVSRDTAGGIFYDMAMHDLDLARFYGGEVDEVTAIGCAPHAAGTGTAASHGAADTTILTVRFADGAIGVVQNSRRAVYGYDIRAELLTEHGKLVVEKEQATPLLRYDRDGHHRDFAQSYLERFRRAYVAEISAFADAVRNGRTPTPGVGDAIEALRLAVAATRSLEEGIPIKVAQLEPTSPSPRRKSGKK